ncbi:HIV Tat-specific factor 1 [Phytophthora boehmeriae]|uniref:HIV Tat-specific factor 1 n=1 Tax=Phytophthora boehmeriae TaxID=109152 RepID=A0A8T1WAQ4_9STRA|nr:HIV Tat-specific factor 1 [Phytophthora boehmeriae]
MRVNIKVHGLQFVVPCGEGTQTCRWLGLAVAQRYALAAPHGRCRTREDAHIKQGSFLPAAVIKSNGQVLQPEKRIADSCKDNETLTVQLQLEVPVNEIGTPQFTTWTVNAFFPSQKYDEAAQGLKADSKQNSSSSSSAKQSPQQISEVKSDRDLVADAKRNGASPSAEELKQYARAEMLQQVNSGQFLSDMEVEAAFLYDWSRLHPEDIEKDPKERELLQELLMPQFAVLNAAYMHYAAGSSELAYGMNGAEFSHFLHECELTRLHDAGNQKTVEKVISQCLRRDTLVAMHDRGTLSRVGFLHALLRLVQTLPETKEDSSSSSFVEKLDNTLKTNICPTITRLTSGPFRDHSHHDKMVAIFQEAKPKLLKLYGKYAQDHAFQLKKTRSIEPEDAPPASTPAISSTWPLLLSASGLKSMLYDCGMFCSGTPEEQEALFDRALEQSFSGMRDVESIEDRQVVFAEFLEVTARVALAVLENENELPPQDAIKLALDAVRSLPLKPEAPRARK